MLYVWCVELCDRQFWSTEVNPRVCLVDGTIWQAVSVYGVQSGCMFGVWNFLVGSFGLWRSIRCKFGACIYMVGNFVHGGQPGCMFWCMDL